MCGLFGLSLHPDYRETVQREQLAVALYIMGESMDYRGGDSWGMAVTRPSPEPKLPTIYKGLSNISPQVPHLTAKMEGCPSIILGHTRKATTGEVITANSHPFDIGNVIGAHNGIVYNHTDLGKSWNVQYRVDSELIMHALAGRQALKDIRAYGAVTFHRKNVPNRLFLGRFNGGQLSILGLGTHPNPVGTLYASTEGCLHKAAEVLGFSKINTFSYECKEGVLYYIEDGKLWALDEEYLRAIGTNKVQNHSRTYTASGAYTTFSRQPGPIDIRGGYRWTPMAMLNVLKHRTICDMDGCTKPFEWVFYSDGVVMCGECAEEFIGGELLLAHLLQHEVISREFLTEASMDELKKLFELADDTRQKRQEFLMEITA